MKTWIRRSGLFVLLAMWNVVQADVEPNNSIATAESATLGVLGGSLSTTDADDFYQIVLPADGMVSINFTFEVGFNGLVRLYNADGGSIGSGSVATVGGLDIDGVAQGTVYVQISRWSGTMSTYTLSVALIQPGNDPDVEPNNSIPEISETLGFDPAGQEGHLGYTNGSIFPLDGTDLYLVNIPGDGRLTIDASCDNTLTTTLAILNRDGSTLGTSSVSATPSLSVDGIGGDFVYVRVNRWVGAGSYQVTANLTPSIYDADVEPNSSSVNAIAIPASTYKEGHLGYSNGAAYPLDGSDWYQTVLSGDGRITLEAETDNGLLLVLRLYNQDAGTLTSSAVSATPSLTYDGLAQDTIYFAVDRWTGVGGYQVRYLLDTPEHPNDSEPNNVIAQALPLDENTDATGHLGYSNGVEIPVDGTDFYELDLAGDGRVTAHIETDNGLSLTLALFNQSEGSLGSSPINDTLSFSVDGIAQGPVYLRVSRWSGVGSYRLWYELLEVAEANDSEPNNVIAEAGSLGPNVPVTGHLGYANGTPVPTDGIDHYLFTETGAGNITFNWATSNGLNIVMAILNSGGGVVASSPISTSGSLTYNVVTPGTYYLRVTRWSGVGGYSAQLDNGCLQIAAASEQVISVGARLQWAAVGGASSYDLRRGPAGGPFSVINTTAKKSIWYPLTEDTDYEWQVQTVCGARTSGYSPIRPFTTLEFPICPNISGLLEDSLSANSITLSWNTNPYAIGYRVEYRVAGGPGGSAVNTTATSVTLNSLLPGTNYEYRVAASCYGDGFSNYRNGTFTTPGARLGQTANTLELWPVPANTALYGSITLTENTELVIQVVDVLGRMVVQQRESAASGAHRFELHVAGVPAGWYQLQIADPSGKLLQQKAFEIQ